MSCGATRSSRSRASSSNASPSRPEASKRPDGSVTRDDDALSAWLGRPVTLLASDEQVALSYENVVDYGHEPTSDWQEFVGAAGAFHDSPAFRVSLVSQVTIGSWDRGRFRSNVLLDGEGEDGLVGRRVAWATRSSTSATASSAA